MKNKILWIILDSVFVIAFNLIFFIIKGIDNSNSVWLCYGIIHFSYFIFLITKYFSQSGKYHHIFVSILYTISFVYLFIEIILCSVFVFFYELPFNTTLVIQTIATS